MYFTAFRSNAEREKKTEIEEATAMQELMIRVAGSFVALLFTLIAVEFRRKPNRCR